MENGMIELGKTQCLNVVKIVDFGIYLGTEEDKVLLPKKKLCLLCLEILMQI